MTAPDKTCVFLFGSLRDRALRRIVLGADVPVDPAYLEGGEVFGVAGADWPVLVMSGQGRADGEVAYLTADVLERADDYEGLFGYRRRPVVGSVAGQDRAVDVWCPADAPEPSAEPWSLSDWQQHHAPLARHAAEEVMRLRGAHPADVIARRWPMIRARAQARLNAAAGGPTTLRRQTTPGDVALFAQRTPYAGFFAVEEYDLDHALFGGGRSAQITRAAFISADAVTVLPYDPVRDRVLLIEQFRAGPYARGDAQCWSLEAIAGRIDGGETPQDTARRESREEAGLEVDRLIPLASYYPSPGAKSEFLYSFLAIADLPDRAAGLGGLAEEHEDIRAHVISFERLMALVASGEVNNAPLILSAMALEAQRSALRADVGPAPARVDTPPGRREGLG